ALGRWARLELMDLARVIDEVELAVAVGPEANDLQPGPGQLLAPGHLAGHLAQAPHLARRIVAVDIRPLQVLEALAAIDVPARDGARLGVRVLDERLDHGAWPQLPMRMERMAALEDA